MSNGRKGSIVEDLNSSSHSLQAAMLAHSISPSRWTSEIMEKHFLFSNKANSSRSADDTSITLEGITPHPSQCSVLASTICHLNGGDADFVSFLEAGDSLSRTLEQGLALANAASAAVAAFKSRIPHPNNVSTHNPTASLPSSDSGSEDANTRPARKNPFASARERFEEEGGNVDSLKRSASSIDQVQTQISRGGPNKNSFMSKASFNQQQEDALPEELAHCDKALVERIESEIVHHGQPITFADISGLKAAKDCVIEPMAQPELFQGLRALPRGLLLFGPPGTGKTLIGKAIAHQSGATFFSISASSLMSKWIGEGEKTVRALFAVAAYRQPSVIFVDEVDSLLCQRSSEENEASRRMKTEFMVQLDGASTKVDARVVIIGATNRPEELDEAVRRRFVKRIYIPLPDEGSRKELLKTLLRDIHHSLNGTQIEDLVRQTAGFSGADVRSLCTEAAMGPIREVALTRQGNLQNIRSCDIPPITINHFLKALATVKPTVSSTDLQRYLDWNNTYGSYRVD
eukprot:scaffold1034_cov175-Ochromonas_danica.AAC.18